MPLPEKDGPFGLIVPGEKRQSRWVRKVKSLSVGPLPTSEAVRWIAESLLEMQTIKIGMTRGDLLKVFREEGGLSTRDSQRYVYERCPYIKVDVRFAIIGDPDWRKRSLEDRIVEISKPYLEWMIVD